MASFQAAVPLAAFLLAGCPVMVFFLYSIEGVNSAISGSKLYDTPRMPGAPDLLFLAKRFCSRAIIFRGCQH